METAGLSATEPGVVIPLNMAVPNELLTLLEAGVWLLLFKLAGFRLGRTGFCRSNSTMSLSSGDSNP